MFIMGGDLATSGFGTWRLEEFSNAQHKRCFSCPQNVSKMNHAQLEHLRVLQKNCFKLLTDLFLGFILGALNCNINYMGSIFFKQSLSMMF